MSINSHTISKQSPVVICGTGGSGTRVIEQLFEKSGYFMGNIMNESKDAMHFQPFLAHAVQPVLSYTRSVDYRVEDLPDRMGKNLVGELNTLIDQHSGFITDDAIGWGWKNPRFIYLLPLLHAARPDFHFVHVVRDGRDMALSNNQNQLLAYYEDLFGVPYKLKRYQSASLRMWKKVNMEAAAFAKRVGCGYTLIRYEDICNDSEAIPGLRQRFSLPERDLTGLVNKTSIGKYKKLPANISGTMEKTGEEGLKFFGYL